MGRPKVHGSPLKSLKMIFTRQWIMICIPAIPLIHLKHIAQHGSIDMHTGVFNKNQPCAAYAPLNIVVDETIGYVAGGRRKVGHHGRHQNAVFDCKIRLNSYRCKKMLKHLDPPVDYLQLPQSIADEDEWHMGVSSRATTFD